MSEVGERAAGPIEVWAARVWNIFNEGRPFSIVYPQLVLLLAAAIVGLAPLASGLYGHSRGLGRTSRRCSPQ